MTIAQMACCVAHDHRCEMKVQGEQGEDCCTKDAQGDSQFLAPNKTHLVLTPLFTAVLNLANPPLLFSSAGESASQALERSVPKQRHKPTYVLNSVFLI